MFQLIVTIISIALIVALALASIFYGGSAFTNSAAKTTEAALVNGGQQIAAAEVLYSNDNGGSTEGLTALEAGDGVTTYLAAIPSLPSAMNPNVWTMNADNTVASVAFSNAGTAAAVCTRVSKDNGGVAANSSPTGTTPATVVVGDLLGAQFNCLTPSSGSAMFAYKL